MAGEKFAPPTQSRHYHLMQSSLGNYGMSYHGVQQVLQGQPLTSAGDRAALASFLQAVLNPGAKRGDWNEPKRADRHVTAPLHR